MPQPASAPRILVTGAAGMVGRLLVSRLADMGLAVRGLDLAPGADAPGGDWLRADLLDAGVADRAVTDVDTIVHGAARQYHSGVPRWGREAFFRANVTMTENLVQAARRLGARRFIFLSSDFVYGLPAGRPFHEGDPLRPLGPYGRSKVDCEELLWAAAGRDLRVVILRPRFIVGPGRLGVLEPVFARIAAGRRLPLIGDGANRYQMVAVEDVVSACVLAMQADSDGVYNLGSDDPPPLRRLLSELCTRAGSPSRLSATPARLVETALGALDLVRLAPLRPEQYRLAAHDCLVDTGRAARELHWRPRLDDGEALWRAWCAWRGERVEPLTPETVTRAEPAPTANAAPPLPTTAR